MNPHNTRVDSFLKPLPMAVLLEKIAREYPVFYRLKQNKPEITTRINRELACAKNLTDLQQQLIALRQHNVYEGLCSHQSMIGMPLSKIFPSLPTAAKLDIRNAVRDKARQLLGEIDQHQRLKWYHNPKQLKVIKNFLQFSPRDFKDLLLLEEAAQVRHSFISLGMGPGCRP
jgi:hypothetical protein